MLFRARWSLRTLVMSGFAVVMLLLAAAVGYAIYSIDQLATKSERVLTEGVYTARLTDQLRSQIPDLQRAARQYQILESGELAEVYVRRHQRLLETVDALEAYPWPDGVGRELAELREGAETLMTQLFIDPGVLETDRYAALQSLAHDMHEEEQINMDQALTTLRADVDQLRNALLALVAVLAAVAVLFVASFSRLVSRPIDQIGAGIRGLGRASFDQVIQVTGPTDLEAIGRLLDWLRERLKHLEEQKVTFVRHMSHELKTPLSNIREGSELLYDDLARSDDTGLRELAGIVRDNGIRLQKLIHGLFDFAAWEDERTRLYTESFDLGAVIDEVLADYRLDMATYDITAETRSVHGLLYAGDRRRIHSLLDNLVSNAVKYSPRGGTICIETEVTDDIIHIHVRDQGPGIPAEHRSKVFLPFFQGRQPSLNRARIRGTGIGLSVARACVSAHGGDIEIVEQSVPGAHFHVRLPKQGAIDAVTLHPN